MKITTIAASAAPARPRGRATKSQQGEPALALVASYSPRTVKARGGNLIEKLQKRGFDTTRLVELRDFPSTCPGNHEIDLVFLELAPGQRKMTHAKAFEEARKQGFEPACGCEFWEWMLDEALTKKPSAPVEDVLAPDVTFFTQARRRSRNNDGAPVMLAAYGDRVLSLRSHDFLIGGMVLVCVTASTAAARKK